MMKKEDVIKTLREEKAMIFQIPKILCLNTYYAIDILVYDLLDKILFYSKDNTGILYTLSAAKDLCVEEKKILRSLRHLGNSEIVNGKFIEEKHEYIFTIDYEKLLILNDYHKVKKQQDKTTNMTEEEKMNLIHKISNK